MRKHVREFFGNTYEFSKIHVRVFRKYPWAF